MIKKEKHLDYIEESGWLVNREWGEVWYESDGETHFAFFYDENSIESILKEIKKR